MPEKENFGQKFLIIRIDFSEYFCFWQNSGFFSDVQFFYSPHSTFKFNRDSCISSSSFSPLMCIIVFLCLFNNMLDEIFES